MAILCPFGHPDCIWETSYKWQSYTFSPVPSLLKREVDRKSWGVHRTVGFFSVTIQVRHQPGRFAGNHAFWRHWIIKSLSAHAQCSFTSVRVFVNVCVWVCFCFTELLGSLLKRYQSNKTFHFPSLPGQWTFAWCPSETEHACTYDLNKIYTVCTDWSSQLL